MASNTPTLGRHSKILVHNRGATKYFHGREDVQDLVANWRAVARAHRGGTTILIQGAPGAGKSALLHQCAGKATRDGWQVVTIQDRALYDPATMSDSMGKPYRATEPGVNGRLVVNDGKFAQDVGGISTVFQLLRSKTPKRGLLLILDEVQDISDYARGPHSSEVKNTLKAIHNGQLGRPVILLAGGLSTSGIAFGELGISRFFDGCLVNLGRMSQAAERAVIQDWLVKDGQAQDDPTPWIDAITRETHGWPQHMMCYAQPAAAIVRRQAGRLTDSGLENILLQGRQRQNAYYIGRLAGINRQDRIAIGHLLRSSPEGAQYDKEAILDTLSVGSPSARANEVFEVLLHKGVFENTDSGSYAVPIPSMRDWLVKEYARKPQAGQRHERYDDAELGQ